MQLTVTQDKLAHALNSTSRVASAKAGLPVLANVLLRTDKTRLYIAATNLELASSATLAAKVASTGEITVPAKLISEFVSNLPKGNVELKAEGSKLHITAGGYSSTINGIEADEFPALPTIDEKKSVHLTLSAEDIKQAAAQTIFACSNDVTRPVLTGVYWHTYEGELYLVGTDGYRLAERRLMKAQSELAAIIPSTTVHEVLRVMSDSISEVDILFDETQVRFRVGDTEITSRLIEGNYPNYRQLIPSSTETNATVKLNELSRTAKIARLFARDQGGSVTLAVDSELSELSIQSVASEYGENKSTITAETNGDGSVSLNSRYLSEALAVIPSDILDIGFSGKLAPIVLRPEVKNPDYTHIIMPLKS